MAQPNAGKGLAAGVRAFPISRGQRVIVPGRV